MKDSLKKLLAPIASLKLTVILLGLAMIVILAGTTAQENMGIWQVQEKYFHSWFTTIDPDLLLPLANTSLPGAIPMLGGYSLIVLLLANLLTAHALRFKVSPWDIVLLPLLGFLLAILWAWQNNHATWLMALAVVVSIAFIAGLFAVHKKRGGVILIHLGLILLLVGEISTSLIAVESRMTIDEGSASAYSFDIREPELSLVDQSGSSQDTVYAVDDAKLKAGNVVPLPVPGATSADQKIEVKVERYFRNAELVQVGSEKATKDAPTVTGGAGLKWQAISRAGFTGVADEASAVDMPAAYVTILKGGAPVGTYLTSTELVSPTMVEINGKPHSLSLRFRRHYTPFRLELKDFRFDRYVGTEKPKNFSSLVRLVDPARNEDREVLISMNNPLRHAGLTFFQADYDKRTEKTTVLQVVRNPGWLIPYVSCVLGGLGMIAHFGIVLVNFLRKVLNPTRATPPALPAGKGGRNIDGKPAPNGNGNGSRGGSYTLEPRRRNWVAIGFASAVGAIAVLSILTISTKSPKYKSSFDLAGFGKIPVSFGGRQQPLDSVARNHLKVISGREEFKDKNGEKQPAIKWLLDMFTRQAGDHKVFRIDESGIKSILAQHLPAPAAGEEQIIDRKLFAAFELGKSLDELTKQADLARNVNQRDRDLFQRKILELSEQLHHAGQAGNVPGLFLVPPMKPGEEWRTLASVFEADQSLPPEQHNPVVKSMIAMLDAYRGDQPVIFNQELARYRTMVGQAVPEVIAKTDTEVRFNIASPFYYAIPLYVFVFLLACGSWLGWREPLRRGAFVLLVITLAFHTIALIARMYISGRPPVTNLYSSAVFIAWGTALIAMLLELLFRNGIGSATAAVTAFPSLIIAQYLSFDGNGDTMEVLQAVLDTNFWLATHVVAITLGYAATFLAGFIGIAYLVFAIATPVMRDPDNRKMAGRMIYGVLCFATLLSFVGTVLGGIWADQSWGRFWGWDPKENGAVLIVLWNAVILHARWSGLVRERGLAVLAIFGNVVTAWSWFGTNMLGVGLHSYGFMDSALVALGGFVFSQFFLIALGALLPQRFWVSNRTVTGPQGRGFEPRVRDIASATA